MSGKVVKSVSFNVNDPYERKMLDFVEKNNKYFATYIKRLIQRDMENGRKTVD